MQHRFLKRPERPSLAFKRGIVCPIDQPSHALRRARPKCRQRTKTPEFERFVYQVGRLIHLPPIIDKERLPTQILEHRLRGIRLKARAVIRRGVKSDIADSFQNIPFNHPIGVKGWHRSVRKRNAEATLQWLVTGRPFFEGSPLPCITAECTNKYRES